MIKKELFKKMPLNLQFFAEGGENEPDDKGTQQQQNKDDKGLDAEQIKSDAINDYLKSLGIESDDALKTIVNKHNDDIKKNRTDLENKDEELKQTTTELAKERSERIKVEAKVEAMILGAKPEMLEDLIVVAMNKVTKDKGVKEVLAEMKAGTNASNYFVSDDEDDKKDKNKKQNNVTNKRVNKTNKDDKNKDDEDDKKHEGSMAERLLAKRKQTKNHYFK